MGEFLFWNFYLDNCDFRKEQGDSSKGSEYLMKKREDIRPNYF